MRPSYNVIVSTQDDTKYCGDLFNSMLCKLLYLNNHYEPSFTQYLKENLKEGDIFVDIGANEGMFSILAGKLVGETGKVYAIEPIPRNISVLKKNIRINKLNNVVVLDVAAGDKNGYITISDVKLNNMLGGVNSGMIRMFSLVPRLVQSTKVKERRLESLIKESPDRIKAVKIDTEGYAEYVLKGIETWLSDEYSIDFFIELAPIIEGHIIDLFINKYNYLGAMHWMDSIAYNNVGKWERLDVNSGTLKNVLFTKNKARLNRLLKNY